MRPVVPSCAARHADASAGLWAVIKGAEHDVATAALHGSGVHGGHITSQTPESTPCPARSPSLVPRLEPHASSNAPRAGHSRRHFHRCGGGDGNTASPEGCCSRRLGSTGCRFAGSRLAPPGTVRPKLAHACNVPALSADTSAARHAAATRSGLKRVAGGVACPRACRVPITLLATLILAPLSSRSATALSWPLSEATMRLFQPYCAAGYADARAHTRLCSLPLYTRSPLQPDPGKQTFRNPGSSATPEQPHACPQAASLAPAARSSSRPVRRAPESPAARNAPFRLPHVLGAPFLTLPRAGRLQKRAEGKGQVGVPAGAREGDGGGGVGGDRRPCVCMHGQRCNTRAHRVLGLHGGRHVRPTRREIYLSGPE